MSESGRIHASARYKRFDVVAYDADCNRVETIPAFCLAEALAHKEFLAASHPRVAIWRGEFRPVRVGEHRDAPRPGGTPARRHVVPIQVGRSYVGRKPRYNHLGQVEVRTVKEVRRRPGLPTQVLWVGNSTFTAKADGVADSSFDDFREWVGDYYIPEPQAAPLRARMAP